jgi:putative solute:sodium symporter small subunit
MGKMDLYSEEYLKTVMGRQLKLSMGISSVFVSIIVAVPLLNKFLPEVMNQPFMGFTLSWFILGFGIFPVLIVLAMLFVRSSNKFEDEAVGMVDPATLPVHDDEDDSAPAPSLGH